MAPNVDVGDLLGATLIIAIGFLLAVAFYESLASRDVLVARARRLARGISARRSVTGVAYLAAVGIGIPSLIVLWTLVLETALFLVGSVELVESVALVAVAIVGAARILAYVREKTAHELAKAVPLALLFLLLSGDNLDIDLKLEALVERQTMEVSAEMLVFLIALELGLRIVTDGSHAVLRAVGRRQGIASDAGVWRTLWAAIRHRRPPTAAPDG